MDRRVIAVIAAGGVLGALTRYQIGVWWPTPPDGFPGATLAVNLVGCLIIGVFLTMITEVRTAHRLVRPFIATGVLGGFTTFSTYAVDVQALLGHGRSAEGLGYLAATAIGSVLAVWLGVTLTRRLAGVS